MLPLGAPRNDLFRPSYRLSTTSCGERLRSDKPYTSVLSRQNLLDDSGEIFNQNVRATPPVILNRYHQGQHTAVELQVETVEKGEIGSVGSYFIT